MPEPRLDSVGVNVGFRDGLDGRTIGCCEGDLVFVGDDVRGIAVGAFDGNTLGPKLGLPLKTLKLPKVGAIDGDKVGVDGVKLGATEGKELGAFEGVFVAIKIGRMVNSGRDGLSVGIADGALGDSVGLTLGELVGASLGNDEGISVGVSIRDG